MQTWVCSLTPPPHHHQFCVGESVRHIWSPPCGCLQDFGEYQESYYSVQTTEGEQISQLIAGYIDIILKKVMQTHSHTHTHVSRSVCQEIPLIFELPQIHKFSTVVSAAAALVICYPCILHILYLRSGSLADEEPFISQVNIRPKILFSVTV